MGLVAGPRLAVDGEVRERDDTNRDAARPGHGRAGEPALERIASTSDGAAHRTRM